VKVDSLRLGAGFSASGARAAFCAGAFRPDTLLAAFRPPAFGFETGFDFAADFGFSFETVFAFAAGFGFAAGLAFLARFCDFFAPARGLAPACFVFAPAALRLDLTDLFFNDLEADFDFVALVFAREVLEVLAEVRFFVAM
jgi:hypothetical protein